MLQIHNRENLEFLKEIKSQTIDLILIDPPFNSKKEMKHTALKTVASEDGDRIGFSGKRYKTEKISSTSYNDSFDDFKSFIYPRMQEGYRILKNNGSFFFWIDDREVHYCKIWLDEIFSRECYQQTLIWSWDYGAKSKTKWSRKSNHILWYTKNPDNYTFNYDCIDRIPYLTEGPMIPKEKLERGKVPTDVWWCSIVGTNSKERTGYSTQKPRKIVDRIVKVHSNEGDLCIDFFAGSGTVGESCYELNRKCILVDNNIQAIETMKRRFANFDNVIYK